MRRFSRVGTSRFEPVQIMGLGKSRAIIQRPPDTNRPGAEFVYPNLTCRVRRDSLVQSGQVVELPDGDRYLVADHSGTIDWITHNLFRCDRQVTWARRVETTHPVTNLPVAGNEPVTIGTPWVMWQRVRREFTDLNLRIDQETHLLATGEDVLENDIIEGFKVKRVNRALGVQILELQA